MRPVNQSVVATPLVALPGDLAAALPRRGSAARAVHLLLLANRHQLSVELTCLLTIGDLQTEVSYPPPHEEPMSGLTRNRQQRLEDHLDGSISRHISDRHAPRPRLWPASLG